MTEDDMVGCQGGSNEEKEGRRNQGRREAREQIGREEDRKEMGSCAVRRSALCWSGRPGKGRGHGIVCSTLKKLF